MFDVQPPNYVIKEILESKRIKAAETLSTPNINAEFNQFQNVSELRKALIHFYVNLRDVPTMADIVKKLGYTAESHHEPALVFRKLGFVYRPLAGQQRSIRSKRGILVEDEKQTFVRHRYLQKLRQFRKEGREIVYVGQKDTASENTLKQKILIAVSATQGLISSIIITVNNETNTTYLRNWVGIDVVPKVCETSVIVFSTWIQLDTTENKVPTKCNTKADMEKWLRLHHIPHDTGLHRAELFQLIETTKRKVCRNQMRDILIVPPELEELDYFSVLYRDLYEWGNIWSSKGGSVNKYDILAQIRTLTISNWKKYDKDLALIEEKVYSEDVEMEEIIDKLLTMAKYGERIGGKDYKKLDLYDKNNIIDFVDEYDHVIIL